jgi:hypothetical protein
MKFSILDEILDKKISLKKTSYEIYEERFDTADVTKFQSKFNFVIVL